MSTRERFGKYLLLKKLTEDPLGETFRAGMLGNDGIERVVLLRIFNGQAIDPQRLWEATKDHGAIHDLLRSPNFGDGVELGELQGIPYMAYEYISGKNLAVLLEQAAKKHHFIPTEHALLISERIALALVVASESRFQGEKLSHGFLVPHLVMISNEGETRLLGFEVAKATRGFAANPLVRRHFGRYLSPEALSGAPPHRSDDVYSLGVMLFELLTGRPLPPPAQDGYGSVIDAGTLATDGEAIPAALVQLLKQSLVAREQRLPDATTWHKTLNKWMFDGQYNPTTFNLAFYMHNLFRDEIERESQEIEVEKTLSLPVVQQPAMAAAAAAAAAVPTQPITPISEEVPVPAADTPTPTEKKSKTGLIAAIAAILIALLAGGFFAMRGGGDKTQDTPVAVAQQPTPPPAPLPIPEEEVDTGPSEEEIALQQRIEELITQRASAMEEQIRGDYDKQLKELQGELEQAKTEAQERERLQREAAELKAREEEDARLLAEKEAAEKLAEEQAAKAQEEEQIAEAEATETPGTTSTTPTEVAQASPPPPPAPPKPAQTQVRRGDLVEQGPGVQPPGIVREALPRFPEIAKRLNKSGATVQVRVLIDENGEVLKAELAGSKKGFGFDAEALQAAKKSTYSAATKSGVPVKMWRTISVVFKR